MARKEVTAISYVRRGDDLVRFDSLSEQDKAQAREHYANVFADVVGDYFRTHPEEKAAYIKAHPDCVIE